MFVQSFEEMVDQAYDSFTVLMEETHEAPVDVDDIYEVLVFDLVGCNSRMEWEMIVDAEMDGATFEQLKEILSR